jgi:hypothetical protein
MIYKILIICSCFLLGLLTQSKAQDLTGTWEGLMKDEYLKINIIQNDNKLCGYTYDVVLKNKTSHCKAYFKGLYDKETKIWTLTGTRFIENQGNHVLMMVKLWKVPQAGNDILRSTVLIQDLFSNFFDAPATEFFWLRRISTKTKSPEPGLPVCDEKTKEKQVTPKKPIITTPEKKKPITEKKDSIKINPTPIEPKPIITKPDSIERKKPIAVFLKDDQLTKSMSKRNQLTLSTLKINSRHVQIKMYDNGTIDNDSVSIFYNGNLLKKHVRLTEEPIILELDLDVNTNSHEITLYAENMGSFPPNTALIVVTCGKKRYELHSSTNFNDNNVLKLEYESPN